MRRIPLRNRAGETIAHALVDDADYALVSGRRWHRSDGYAVSNEWTGTGYRTCRTHRMHRVIIGAVPGVEVDHRNRNRLDNRRANLRIVTKAENRQNRGGRYRGVHRLRAARTRPWEARATLDGRPVSIGAYPTRDEAADAAREWRRRNMPASEEDATLKVWEVRWDKVRYFDRGPCRGQERKSFRGPDAESDARRYFEHLCRLGVPDSFATCKEEV